MKEIKEGKNFQVHCGSKCIDFIVDGMAIEYHPTPEGIDSYNNYKEKREEQIKNSGLNLKLKVIEKENDFLETGLLNSHLEYFKKRRTINKKLEKITSLEYQLKEEDKRIEKIERIIEKKERVAREHKVDEELDKEETISKDKTYDDKVPF